MSRRLRMQSKSSRASRHILKLTTRSNTQPMPISTSVELAARYINDRKLPDKAIDVIDEAGAAQHLIAESKRRKTDRHQRDRGCCRENRPHPAKERHQRRCRGSERPRRVAETGRVWSRSRNRRACPLRSNWPVRVCVNRKSRLATTCSRVQQVWVKPKWPNNWLTRWALNCCALTCRNTWKSTQSPA